MRSSVAWSAAGKVSIESSARVRSCAVPKTVVALRKLRAASPCPQPERIGDGDARQRRGAPGRTAIGDGKAGNLVPHGDKRRIRHLGDLAIHPVQNMRPPFPEILDAAGETVRVERDPENVERRVQERGVDPEEQRADGGVGVGQQIDPQAGFWDR